MTGAVGLLSTHNRSITGNQPSIRQLSPDDYSRLTFGWSFKHERSVDRRRIVDKR